MEKAQDTASALYEQFEQIAEQSGFNISEVKMRSLDGDMQTVQRVLDTGAIKQLLDEEFEFNARVTKKILNLENEILELGNIGFFRRRFIMRGLAYRMRAGMWMMFIYGAQCTLLANSAVKASRNGDLLMLTLSSGLLVLSGMLAFATRKRKGCGLDS